MNQLKGRVLLLNASYEVLGTVGVARAIRLTLREDNPVVVEETVSNRFLTTANGERHPVPSVLRLKHYVNIRKKRQMAGAKRLRIYIRDKYKCQYCGEKKDAKDLTLDHVVPKSKGGEGIAENLVAACKPCNHKKADRTPEQARMPLLTPIHEKRDVGVDSVLLCHYAESNPAWKKYLFLDNEGDSRLSGRS